MQQRIPQHHLSRLAPLSGTTGGVYCDGPDRSFNEGPFQLRGPLTGALSWVAASSGGRPAAGLLWPTDRAWSAATEIEFEWTVVAGVQTLIDRLLTNDRLEVAQTTFDAVANRAAEPS